MTVFIVIAIFLSLAGTVLQLRDWRVARRRLIAQCSHRWAYLSAWGEGRYWERCCRDCPKRESVAREDVPAEWTRRERVNRTQRPHAGPSPERENESGRRPVRRPRPPNQQSDARRRPAT